MGILKNLFGNCSTIRFEGTTYQGEKFTGKAKIESGRHSLEKIEEKMKKVFFVETGKKTEILNIIEMFVYLHKGKDYCDYKGSILICDEEKPT